MSDDLLKQAEREIERQEDGRPGSFGEVAGLLDGLATEIRRLNAELEGAREALEWALAEIEGRTRYDTRNIYAAEEQREECFTKARAALGRISEGEKNRG